MSNLVKHVIGYGVLAIVLGLAVRFAVNEHIDRLLAQKEIQDQQKIADARDEEQRKLSAEFDQKIKAMTPAQAAPIIRTVFVTPPGAKNAPGTPISVPFKDLSPEVQKQLPDAPQLKPDAQVMVLTPNQQTFAAQKILGCEKQAGELSTCQADLETKKNQFNTLQTAEKGGSVGKRLGKELKCLAVGAAGAGLGVLVSPQHKVFGAMGGAVAGEATCKIFF